MGVPSDDMISEVKTCAARPADEGDLDDADGALMHVEDYYLQNRERYLQYKQKFGVPGCAPIARLVDFVRSSVAGPTNADDVPAPGPGGCEGNNSAAAKCAIERGPSFPGLKNLGNTCYLNSLLQALHACVNVYDLIVNHIGQPDDNQYITENGFHIYRELQKIFLNLSHSNDTVDTRALAKSFGAGFSVHEQHDVSELWSMLQLSEKPIFQFKQRNTVEELFLDEADVVQTGADGGVRTASAPRKRFRVETVSCLSLPVRLCSGAPRSAADICPDFSASVRLLRNEEILTGADQWLVDDETGERVDARRYCEFESLPKVLAVHTMSFFVNERYERKKVKQLKMRFVEQLAASSKPVVTEQAGGGASGELAAHTDSVDVVQGAAEPEGGTAVHAKSPKFRKAEEDIVWNVPLRYDFGAALPGVNKEGVYELCGVCLHLGDRGDGGHFVAYALDRQSKQWYFCNDAAKVPVANILQESVSGTPYFLLFEMVLDANGETETGESETGRPGACTSGGGVVAGVSVHDHEPQGQPQDCGCAESRMRELGEAFDALWAQLMTTGAAAATADDAQPGAALQPKTTEALISDIRAGNELRRHVRFLHDLHTHSTQRCWIHDASVQKLHLTEFVQSRAFISFLPFFVPQVLHPPNPEEVLALDFRRLARERGLRPYDPGTGRVVAGSDALWNAGRGQQHRRGIGYQVLHFIRDAARDISTNSAENRTDALQTGTICVAVLEQEADESNGNDYSVADVGLFVDAADFEENVRSYFFAKDSPSRARATQRVGDVDGVMDVQGDCTTFLELRNVKEADRCSSSAPPVEWVPVNPAEKRFSTSPTSRSPVAAKTPGILLVFATASAAAVFSKWFDDQYNKIEVAFNNDWGGPTIRLDAMLQAIAAGGERGRTGPAARSRIILDGRMIAGRSELLGEVVARAVAEVIRGEVIASDSADLQVCLQRTTNDPLPVRLAMKCELTGEASAVEVNYAASHPDLASPLASLVSAASQSYTPSHVSLFFSLPETTAVDFGKKTYKISGRFKGTLDLKTRIRAQIPEAEEKCAAAAQARGGHEGENEIDINRYLRLSIVQRTPVYRVHRLIRDADPTLTLRGNQILKATVQAEPDPENLGAPGSTKVVLISLRMWRGGSSSSCTSTFGGGAANKTTVTAQFPLVSNVLFESDGGTGLTMRPKEPPASTEVKDLAGRAETLFQKVEGSEVWEIRRQSDADSIEICVVPSGLVPQNALAPPEEQEGGGRAVPCVWKCLRDDRAGAIALLPELREGSCVLLRSRERYKAWVEQGGYLREFGAPSPELRPLPRRRPSATLLVSAAEARPTFRRAAEPALRIDM